MSTINNKQKGKIHLYARLARLSRGEYEDILRDVADVDSSIRLDQDGFDRIMPILEAKLWYRVDEGIVPDPAHRGHRLDRMYWRRRAVSSGMADTRHIHKITQLWNMLREYLPDDAQCDSYLAGIISKAAGVKVSSLLVSEQYRAINWSCVPQQVARLTIEALKDRLLHAVRRAA